MQITSTVPLFCCPENKHYSYCSVTSIHDNSVEFKMQNLDFHSQAVSNNDLVDILHKYEQKILQ